MKNKKSLSPGARVAFPLIVGATVCMCGAVLLPGFRGLHTRQAEIEARRDKVEAVEARRLECQREMKELETDDGIARVAREDLHLVKPGERIIVFEQEPATPGERRP